MGCCLATDKPSSSSVVHSQKNARRLDTSTYGPPPKPTLNDRAPPPSADELETVKEVLSETAKPKPPPLPVPEPHSKYHQLPVGISEIHEKQSSIHVVDNMEIEKLSPPAVPSEISGNSEEASDFRSLSFSERSVSTTAALTEKREDDDEEVTQRLFRSPVKLAPPTRKPNSMPRRDRVVGRSPNRRHGRSPGTMANQRSDRVRREAQPHEQGESSGRRSRSPAVNRSAVNRSLSGRRTGKSPGRARVEAVDGSSSKFMRKSNIEEDNDNVTDGGQSESLENPLVSLECFIFL